jgi:hypothetical protein
MGYPHLHVDRHDIVAEAFARLIGRTPISEISLGIEGDTRAGRPIRRIPI